MSTILTDVSVPVRIMLPGPIYKRLHQAAEAHSTTVGALTVELVRRALHNAAGPATPPPREITAGLAAVVIADPAVQKAIARATTAAATQQKRQEDTERRARRPEELKTLHAQGLTDAQIGRHLGLTGARISQLRNGLGLPANGKGGRTRKNPTEASA